MGWDGPPVEELRSAGLLAVQHKQVLEVKARAGQADTQLSDLRKGVIVASVVLVRLLVLAAERLLNSDSLLKSSLFDSRKQAVSFCTEEIRSSIGKSHEMSSLFALLLCFASGLPIQRYRCDQGTVPPPKANR